MFAAQHMEVKRENESLRNKLAEATLMQKKLEQDIVGLEKVGTMHLFLPTSNCIVLSSNTGASVNMPL